MADTHSGDLTTSPSGFHAMTEGTREQWAVIGRADAEYARDIPDRMVRHLLELRNECHGFAIDRLEHCLQTATRAHRDGRDEEYVVCALMHDIGDALAPWSHAEFAAMVLRPFVSERNHWMIRHHGIFQSYYFSHFFGADRNKRDRFRGHPHFEYTAEFCHLYDQSAFDPHYPSLSLDAFVPMVRRVLGQRKRR
jgi:predicted HD phosphohydrolase